MHLGRVQYTTLYCFVCSFLFVCIFSMKMRSTQERTISLRIQYGALQVPSAGYSTFWRGRAQYLLERQGTVPSGKAGHSTFWKGRVQYVLERQGTVPSGKAGMCWIAGEQARSAWCPPREPAHAPSQQLAATVCWREPSCSETLASPPNPLQPTSKRLTSKEFVQYSC